MGNIVNRVFESAGPDGKVRGTPQQIIDKYQALARDAQVAGDRVAAESYLQFSEHYTRLLGEAQRQQQETTRHQQDREDGSRGDDGVDGQQRRQQPPAPQPSGFSMIEPDYADDPSGPIETPEGRRPPADDPAPVIVPVASPRPEPLAPAASEPASGPAAEAPADAAPAEGEPAAAPPKRSRPRRRPKADAPDAGGEPETAQASS
jgi:hypothetical protein